MKARGTVAVGGNPTGCDSMWRVPTRPRDVEAERARAEEIAARRAQEHARRKALENARYEAMHQPKAKPRNVGRPIPITDVLRDREAGMSWARIAEKHHIDRRRIVEALKDAGHTVTRDQHPNTKASPEMAAKAAELRDQGATWVAIAEHLGISETTARRAVKGTRT